MAKGQELSDIEMAWLIAWNIAAGYWNRVGLTPTEARKLMLDFAKHLQGNPVEAVTRSRVNLRQTLMAVRRESFEEIQGEAPFRQHAQQNLLRLLSAYQAAGDSGMTTAWHQVFPEDREVQPVTTQPIRIIENDGESSDTALEVIGAPGRETRVAAEWWYLRYRFGRNFTPGMHMTTTENANGDCFSVHNIALSDGSRKQVYFRLRGGLMGILSDQAVAQKAPMNSSDVSDYIAKVGKLPQTGFVWLLGWNIAAGQWERIGLEPQAAKEYLTDLFGKLQGDVADLCKRSAEQLQHGLMALRIGVFEQIQQEPPFSRFAQKNMERLLQAWRDGGESGFAQVWDATFHPRWQDEREQQYPVRIIGERGDCEQRALEVLSASDKRSRTAAEFWYLFYTFGDGWKWEKHETVGDEHGGPQFSVHHIRVLSDSDRRVYFRLSW